MSEAKRLLLALAFLVTAVVLIVLRYAEQIDKVIP